MSDAAYDGSYGTPISFTFTPTTGTPFGSAQAEVISFSPGGRKRDKATFTPISGANANIKQAVPGPADRTAAKVKAMFSSTEHAAALACFDANVKGTLAVTYGLGPGETVAPTESWSGAFLSEIMEGEINASSLREDDMEFDIPSSSTFTPGH